MILLSNVIKHNQTNENAAKRTIEIRSFRSYQDVTLEEDEQSEHSSSGIMLQQAAEQAEMLRTQAEDYVATSRHAIEQEKQQWLEERSRFVEQAREEGFQLGIEEGKQAGFEQYQQLIQQAREIVDQTKVEYNRYLESSEEVILNLGFALAEKILAQQLELNPDIFSSVVKKAIKEVRDHKNIQVYLSPEYYPLLLERKDELTVLLAGEASLFLYPSDDLQAEACYIESSFGKIDISIDVQLKELKQQLMELLKDVEGNEG